jgi:glycosyltransferase involved in cell wall biosynthesis
MTPSISAIITAYNYARFLDAAITSVLNQTHRPDEIIVVDDGSTDDTAQVVAKYAHEGVRYVYKENGGAGSARNKGIRESKSDLVAFLDGDDQWLPDKLALQVEHMRRYPAAGLVTGSEWQIYSTGAEPMWLHRKLVGAVDMYRKLLVENVVGNPSLTLVRRECFERVGMFDEMMRLGQDWDMWIRIAREYHIGVVDATLILFVRHPGSLTARPAWDRYRSNRVIQGKYIRAIRSPLSRLSLLLAAQSMNCYYTAAALLEQTAPTWQARSLALAAVLLDPTYETKLKMGVLFRAMFGRAALLRLRQLLPYRRAAAHDAAPPPSEVSLTLQGTAR